MKKKKTKVVYLEDDGHTVYSMENLDGNGAKKNKDEIKLEKKEKSAAIRAAFAVYFPRLLLIIGCFVVVGLLTYLWLS